MEINSPTKQEKDLIQAKEVFLLLSVA